MQSVDIILSPQASSDINQIKDIACKTLHLQSSDVQQVKILRKSIDARKKDILVNLKVGVFLFGESPENLLEKYVYKQVSDHRRVVVVGAGPSGLFAALRLIELGIKPIILERGKNVSDRKRDVALLSREHLLNPESNYCFGEGGAGTFSDGKLYTRSNKRGDISRILEIFHIHGASEDILFEARPHIGTDKLPKIIENIRNTIINCGGEVHFNTRVDDIIVENNKIVAVKTSTGKDFVADAFIFATGHSADDTYQMLNNHKVKMETKGFAVGVRVEHPKDLINEIQYKRKNFEYLPTASYSVVCQVEDRGVYSFCMCPGGTIVPSATAEKQTVVNGMSGSLRNNRFSNSGIVVEIRPEDLPSFDKDDALCGLKFRQNLEFQSYINGNSSQSAPGQRLDDFVKGRISSSLPESSYVPGNVISPVHFWLPEMIGKRLQEGFKQFDKKMKGFVTQEAMVMSVESRTSSPVRIVRDEENLSSITLSNMFPCGEGAGYAGGIVSSAMDGESVAQKAFYLINN